MHSIHCYLFVFIVMQKSSEPRGYNKVIGRGWWNWKDTDNKKMN